MISQPQLTSPVRRPPIHSAGWRWVLFGLAAAAWPILAQAQLINPSAPPPAGQTAKPLTTADSVQKKLGSLVVGVPGRPPAKLCLNGDGIVDCISDWSDLKPGGVGFLNLRPDSFDIADIQSNVLPTKIDPNRGYVRIKGADGQLLPYTVNLNPNALVAGSSALYADAMSSGNYAGYFVGNVSIDSFGGTSGRLCLNSINGWGGDATETAKGYYCISQWTEIHGAPILDKLTRVTSTLKPDAESGHVLLGQSFGSGSVVIGDTINLSLIQSCGDGYCSAAEKASNCPIDCTSVTQLTSFTATPQDGRVKLEFKTSNDSSSQTKVRVFIVRSDQANRLFRPVDGIIYPISGTATFATVISGEYTENTAYTVDDTGFGMANNRTFIYRAYQGNLYPRYSPETTASAVLGEGDPPIIRRTP